VDPARDITTELTAQLNYKWVSNQNIQIMHVIKKFLACTWMKIITWKQRQLRCLWPFN